MRQRQGTSTTSRVLATGVSWGGAVFRRARAGLIVLLGLGLMAACGPGTSRPAPPPGLLAATPTLFVLPVTAVAPLDATTCPPAAPIKGYRNKHGVRLYRTPQTRDSARVTPEACFATEAAAVMAGYRRADAT